MWSQLRSRAVDGDGGMSNDNAENSNVIDDSNKSKQNDNEVGETQEKIFSAAAAAAAATTENNDDMQPLEGELNIDAMKVVELRIELKKRGLNATGRKSELQQRLCTYLSSSTSSTSNIPVSGDKGPTSWNDVTLGDNTEENALLLDGEKDGEETKDEASEIMGKMVSMVTTEKQSAMRNVVNEADNIVNSPSVKDEIIHDNIVDEGGRGRDNGVQSSSTPPTNTFIGDRGGDAIDDELLAELRAISAKSSSSNRFDSGDGEDDHHGASITDNNFGMEEKKSEASRRVVLPPLRSKESNNNKMDTISRPLPPWKTKGAKTNPNVDMDIVLVAAPPPASIVLEDNTKTTNTMNTMALLPTTTVDGNNTDSEKSSIAVGIVEESTISDTPRSVDELSGSSIRSNLPKTFVGDRGGTAEDADLLAELRAISNKSSSSSSNRFNDDDNDDKNNSREFGSSVVARIDNASSSIKSSEMKSKPTRPPPPWKQKKGTRKKSTDVVVDIAVKAPVPLDPFGNIMLELDENKTHLNKSPIQSAKTTDHVNADITVTASSAPSEGNDDMDYDDDEAFFPNRASIASDSAPPAMSDSFTAVRSGPAEDPELLAELRNISMKTSKSRFDEENTTANESTSTVAVVKHSPVPPRKQKIDTNHVVVKDTIAVPNPTSSIQTLNNPNIVTSALKSDLPNTFMGERGGPAEDEELLAELRAISMKSKSAFNRFAGDENHAEESNAVCTVGVDMTTTKPASAVKMADKTTSRALPPWKQKIATQKSEIDIVIAAPPKPSKTITDKSSEPITSASTLKSNLPNTFKGDRGGPAEDEALLAELRAISMKSATARFGSVEAGADMNRDEGPDIHPKASSEPSGSLSSTSNSIYSVVPAFPMQLPHDSTALDEIGPPPSSNGEEIIITLEGLDESLKSSNWQMRKAAYVFLNERMRALSIDTVPSNLLSTISVYDSLDQAIIKALNDKNAGALDAALTLSITYAETCQDASSDDAISQIMKSLLKGPAFLSARSSTLASTEELVLKLIEISRDGSSSIQDIFDLIQLHGLKSVKPKVVIFSAKLILKAVQSFGASVLPIQALKASSESLVAHSNAQAREIGMQLLAEICRALGSKGPLQILIEKLKTAQQSQLDSLLMDMSTSVPSRRLRRNIGQPISLCSPDEVLAALKKSQEEDELRRLASRPAVNLFHVLSQTCYKEKIKLEKWSEKVAALDALIGAGGEQPFKLCQPSSSIDYTELISELKKLLSHTHFAVCSKSLAAFGMLAEGVGEKMFHHLRFLIPTFVSLFKDKKVVNAVGSCLDKMFANVFSFEHLLDSKDSLPSSIDEKKQKNALVRRHCLEYLNRCIQSSGTYGTRGEITIQYANDISKLACASLADSDVATRKAGTDVLLALVNNNDEAIATAAKKTVSSLLQTTNPRALKSLMSSSNVSEETTARPRTAPNSLSTKLASKERTSEPSKQVVAKEKIKDPSRATSGHSISTASADEGPLPTFDDSVNYLSALGIPKWDDDVDNEGVLAGIQSSNWKAKMSSFNQLAEFYSNANEESALVHVPSLFVVARDCTKSFKDLSNFNVAKAVLSLFTTIFGIYFNLKRAPDSYLYFTASKLAVEKIGDKKLYEAASSCLHSICVVKDPQRILTITAKSIGDIPSPLVHEAFLGWFKTFCLDFGASSLSNGLQDTLLWILKECESNNIKVRTAALDVIGEMHSQLGPVLHAFIKSNAIQPSIMTLLEKAIYSRPYDHTAQSMERRLKCITLSVSTNSTSQPSSMSILSISTTDLVASLSSDYLSRLNSTEGKTAWKIRRDALDEIKMNVEKCGGLIATNGSSFAALKQLFAALCSRLNDSQSNLKPMAATLIGAILSLVDDDSKAKLGRIVFAALLSGAMNDMKKMMRDAALSAIAMGTEQSKQNGGGTNILAVESLIVCFESSLSEAALKSSGLPDVLSFLNDRLQSFYSIETTDKPNFISVHSQLAKVIVLSLLSSKSEIRSASEKLLNTCATSGIVPMEDIDNEIRKLLPAQQRSIRSIIPKISTQDQELVDSFKQASARARTAPIRTTSSSQQPVRQMTAKGTSMTASSSVHNSPSMTTKGTSMTASSSVHNSPSSEKHNDINPLHSSTAKKSTKDQRLSLLSRGDHWPFYPEEPSGNVILQTVCKSWSQLISAQSIQVLFPNGGLRSHEDAVGGCELISRSINCSESFLNQLDLIFKWTSCALLSRDHTSGLRSLLSMLQLMFKRLLEISYVMQDSEAIMLLPYILEKASVAKSQFKEQFADVLSLIRNGLYPLQRYGSIICISVIAKSKSSPARSLAAIECTTCVKEVGTGALGRNGVEKIAKALSIEKLLDIRVVYLDLFDAVTTKSSLEKVIELCTGDGITDKAKEMIIDRCSKRPLTAPPPNHTKSKNEIDRNHLKTSIPARKSLIRTSTDSLNAGMEKEHQFSSSSVVTGTLKSRLQRLRDETQKTEGSTSQPTPEPTELESLDVYTNSLDDVIAMINGDITLETGLKAVQRLCLVAKNASDGPLSASQLESLRQDISSDLDRFVETFASALKCAFLYKGGSGVLPCPLIEEIVDALTYVFRTPEYSNAISQQAVECCIQEAVHALLDDRLDASKGAKADRTGIIVKAINKLAMRAAAAPHRETSLSALLSLQLSAVSSIAENGANGNASRASRVYTKLFQRVMKDEYEKNPTNPLCDVTLDLLLYSLDWLLQTIDEVSLAGVSGDLIKNAEDMTKDFLTELVKCRGESVREALIQLEDLPEGGLVDKLLVECEHKLGMRPPQFVSVVDELRGSGISPQESKQTRFAELVNNFAVAEEGSDKQIALLALIDFKKSNDIDLEASLSHLSPHFKEFILDQIGKASKENCTEDTMGTFNERMKNLRLKVGQHDQVVLSEGPPVADKAASLRARLEALKHSVAGVVAVDEVSNEIGEF